MKNPIENLLDTMLDSAREYEERHPDRKVDDHATVRMGITCRDRDDPFGIRHGYMTDAPLWELKAIKFATENPHQEKFQEDCNFLLNCLARHLLAKGIGSDDLDPIMSIQVTVYNKDVSKKDVKEPEDIQKVCWSTSSNVLFKGDHGPVFVRGNDS